MSFMPLAGKTTPTPSVQIANLDPLVTPRVLTVGSFTNYLPQEYLDSTTRQLTGFDVDLAQALGGQLGMQVHIVSDDYSQLIVNLLDKHYDVVISAFSLTPEIQKKVNFIPYFHGGESLMVRSGNPDHIQSLDDLCGLAVAARDGTFEQQELRQESIKCTKAHKDPLMVQIANEQSEVLSLLRDGRVSAVYQDSPLTDYYVKLYPQEFMQGGDVINATVEGILVRKEDTATLQALQDALKKIETNGTYHRLITKWGLFHGDIMVTTSG
jgi:polar amino acid transport system substrate-binding protein